MAIGAYVAFRPDSPPASRERWSAGGMYRSRVRAARAQRRVPCVQPPLRDPRLRRRRDLVDLPKIGAAATACRGLRGRRTRRCSGDPNPIGLGRKVTMIAPLPWAVAVPLIGAMSLSL